MLLQVGIIWVILRRLNNWQQQKKSAESHSVRRLRSLASGFGKHSSVSTSMTVAIRLAVGETGMRI